MAHLWPYDLTDTQHALPRTDGALPCRVTRRGGPLRLFSPVTAQESAAALHPRSPEACLPSFPVTARPPHRTPSDMWGSLSAGPLLSPQFPARQQGGSDQGQPLRRPTAGNHQSLQTPELRPPKAQAVFKALKVLSLRAKALSFTNKVIRWDLEGSSFGSYPDARILSFRTTYLGLSYCIGAPSVSIGVGRPGAGRTGPGLAFSDAQSLTPSASSPGSDLSPGHTRPRGTPSPFPPPHSTNQLPALPSQIHVSFKAHFQKPPQVPSLHRQ